MHQDSGSSIRSAFRAGMADFWSEVRPALASQGSEKLAGLAIMVVGAAMLSKRFSARIEKALGKP